MLRTITNRAAVALPMALAIALICNPTRGFAQGTTPNTVQGQLNLFVAQETIPGAAQKAVTVATATADDLVFAVYNALQARVAAGTITPNAAASLAAEALTTTGGKTRADKDKIAGRIVTAAILGSGFQGDASAIAGIVNAVGQVNPGTTKTLTAAGRALAVSAALKASSPDAGAGAAIAGSAVTLAGLGKEQAFALSVLKLQTNNPLNVADFTAAILNNISGGNSSNTVATTLAAGVATQPAVAGAVIGGRAQVLSDSANSDTAVQGLITEVVNNAKLAKVVGDAIASSDQYLSGAVDRAQFAGTLAGGNKKVAAGVAAGFVRNADSSDVDGIVGSVITSGAVTIATFPTFAATAALGVGENGDELTTALINRRSVSTVVATDRANIIKIAAAVANSVALANPDAVTDIGTVVATSTRDTDGAGPSAPVDVYTQAELGSLANALAKAVNKNYTATGAVVAGVASASTAQDTTTLAGIANQGTLGNAAASAGIALKVASLLTGDADIQAFATTLADTTKSTNGANIALGVALANPNQSGALTRAISLRASMQKSTVKIATAVANGVDAEYVADVAEKVATLFQPATGGIANLPKVSTMAAFATALTKSINAKPIAPKATQVSGRGAGDTLYASFSWSNRVDEIGELAASLVKAAVQIPGGDDTKVIGAIGTAIYKAVSQKLLADAGKNQADIKDVAQDVAGSIFQAISTSALTANFTVEDRNRLLDNTVGSKTNLVYLLTKSALKYTDA